MSPQANPSTSNGANLNARILLAMILAMVALLLPLVVVGYVDQVWGINPVLRRILEPVLVSTVVVIGIWLLRKRIDRGKPISIGIGDIRQAIGSFLIGFGLLLVPLILSLLITRLFGWAEIIINWKSAQVDMILLGMLLVFLTDALPEELIFRGYIYSNLQERFVKWKSALIALVLFVLFPIIYIPLKSLFGSAISGGIVDSLSGGYITYLFFFGAFATYLRILTGTIWTGVGFHLMFVYINQLIGLEPTNLVQFSEFSNEGLTQGTFVSLLLLTFGLLLFYPRLKGRKLGWFSKGAE